MSDSIVIVGAARTPMGAFQGDFAGLTGGLPPTRPGGRPRGHGPGTGAAGRAGVGGWEDVVVVSHGARVEMQRGKIHERSRIDAT